MITDNAEIIYLWIILSTIIIFLKLVIYERENIPGAKANMTGIEKNNILLQCWCSKIIGFIWNLNVPSVHLYVDI